MSKAQWRFAFASKQSWAHRVAHDTKGGEGTRYRRLPPRKRRPTVGTAR